MTKDVERKIFNLRKEQKFHQTFSNKKPEQKKQPSKIQKSPNLNSGDQQKSNNNFRIHQAKYDKL